MVTNSDLAKKLILIVQTDVIKSYDYRAILIYEAIALALRLGYAAGFRIDPAEPDWPVAFIETPKGQISYHLEAHDQVWDGHTTDQKNLRILNFIASVAT
jgi:hypothetical protein